MVQKYQNESAPIFYLGKSPKTSRKHLKIPYFQALTLGRVIKMTLYIEIMLGEYSMDFRYSLYGRIERILFDGGSGVAETASTSNANGNTLSSSTNSTFLFNRARPCKQ